MFKELFTLLYADELEEENVPNLVSLHRVSKKNVQNCFCQSFVKFLTIFIIFGRMMAKKLELCKVYSFSTSPNLRCHTTVLNADVPNCHTTLKVVICYNLQ